MPQVGNDIVDLTHFTVRKKSRNIRFLNRVFTPEEQCAILSSPFPDLSLWSYWAAKEAAYKAISKTCPDVPAIPRRYSVFLDEEESSVPTCAFPRPFPQRTGYVLTPRGKCRIRVDYRHTYLHCVALTDNPGRMDLSWRVHYLYKSAPDTLPSDSEAVRVAARLHLCRKLGENYEDLEIPRLKNGVSGAFPQVFCRGRLLDVDISLSHDGLLVAYACLIPGGILPGVFRIP